MNRIVTADRCSQLNGMRLRGEFVDVVFVVQGQSFPAHRAIVGPHSPVLRMLIWGSSASPPPFADCEQRQIVLNAMTPGEFDAILAYFYQGRIKITEENVTSVLRAQQFLQIEDKWLSEECFRLIEQILNRVDGCQLQTFVNIWKLAEEHDIESLKRQVFWYLRCNFEALANGGILEEVGCEEIRSILSMDNFCAKSEKLLFDYLVSWFSKWEEEESCTIEKHSREIFQLLYLDLLNENYVRSKLYNILPEVNLKPVARRSCKECSFICLGTRLEGQVYGLPEFVEERKQQLYFIKLRPSTDQERSMDNISFRWEEIASIPNLVRPAALIAFPRQLFAFIGEKQSQRDQTTTILKLSLECFIVQGVEQFGLPHAFDHVNTILVDETVYLVGGFEKPPTATSVQPSLHAFAIEVKNLKNAFTDKIKINWVQLANLPLFLLDSSPSLVAIDNYKIYVIGRSFCCMYKIKENEWADITVPFQCTSQSPHWRPAVTSIGTNIFCFHDSQTGCWKLDTHTLIWSRFQLPIPEYEIPISAYSHNGTIYLIARCLNEMKLFSFNPQTDVWVKETTSKCGNISPGGVLIKDIRIGQRSRFI